MLVTFRKKFSSIAPQGRTKNRMIHNERDFKKSVREQTFGRRVNTSNELKQATFSAESQSNGWSSFDSGRFSSTYQTLHQKFIESELSTPISMLAGGYVS